MDHVLESNEQFSMAASLILRASGEDVEREGLERTPERFRKAMIHLLSGYEKTPQDVVGEGVFKAEGTGLVSVRDVEFYSLCEHHMLPFWGKASVAYYPRKKILGLSKIPRLVDLFARRFQVQERLTEQLSNAMVELLSPRAVAVRRSRS
jgi:GTP cyclohydrolase I